MPFRILLSIAVLLFTWACAGSGSKSFGPQPLDSATVQLAMHPAYMASFDALRVALEADDLRVARATLGPLRRRLAADLQTAPTLAEARTRNDEVSLRTLAGELPSLETVRAAIRMADSFGRIVDGRTRLGAVSLSVQIVRVPDEMNLEIRLTGTSDWDEPLTIRPSAASLVTERTSLEPKTGQERRSSTRRALDEAPVLTIPGHGTAHVVISVLPIEVPVGAIATRIRINLACNGGLIEEDGRRFPAKQIEVSVGERTDLAGWVPASLVDPGQLVDLVERGGGALPRMIECAVRIDPERRPETLDRIGVAVQTLPVESMRTVVPAVRWLSGTNRFGRDEAAWRTWLIERVEERQSEGTAVGV